MTEPTFTVDEEPEPPPVEDENDEGAWYRREAATPDVLLDPLPDENDELPESD